MPSEKNKIYLDRPSIIHKVGITYYYRGQNYFTCGHVIEIDMQGAVISGSITGNMRRPYQTSITLGPRGIDSSKCTCPIGGGCKHVAALAIAALKKYGGDILIIKTNLDQISKLPIKNQKKIPQWVESLNFIEEKITEKSCDQLQFLLQFKSTRSYGVEEKQWELQIRPRMYNPKTKETSINAIDWSYAIRDRYYYGDNRNEPTPENMTNEHFLFFKQLANALNIDYSNRKWEKITLKNASNFWNVLKRAKESNVSLFCGPLGKTKLEISPYPFDASLIFSDLEDGSLEISREFTLGDALFENQISYIGDPPVFGINILGETKSSNITSFSLISISNPAAKILKDFKELVTIPKKDRAMFQEKYMPILSQRYQFKNNSSKLSIPKKIEPKILLQIDSDKKNQINLSIKALYENIQAPLDNPSEIIKNNTGQIIQRDIEAEDKLIEDFQKKDNFGKLDIENIFKKTLELEGIAAAKLMIDSIPSMQNDSNMKIEITENVPKFYEDKSDPKISFELNDDSESSGWFDLGIKIKMDNESIIFSEVFTALSRGDEFYITESGRYFSLKNPAFDRLKKLILESQNLKDAEKGSLKLSRFQIGFWEELEQLGIIEKQAESWQNLLGEFKNSQGTNLLAQPKELKLKLRTYQIEGYSWLKFLYRFKLGGILADDMGLGKTIQAIALIIDINKEKKNCPPFLVIAPTSVVENWEMELDHFAPQLKKIIMRRGDRREHFNSMKNANIVITSYSLFQRDFEELQKHTFEALILDEAQFVKNHQTKAYSLLRKLNIDTKIALTGTPMENNLMELWSIFSLVAPGLFPSAKKFQEIYRKPIEKNQDQEMLGKLRTHIKPFLLRRKKELVAKELPPKTQQVVYLELNEKHRHIYDLHLQKERQKVLGLLENGNLNDNRFEILKSLTKMRQLCLHPVLIDDKYKKIPATKLDALLEQVKDLISEGHYAIIFSQFTSLLSEVKKVFDKEHIDYLYLDGSVKNRRELIDSFQAKTVPIFLISLKAGGFGLNLTAADYCILLDPWWNPATENQAIDRTHRIGQKKPVFVYKYIAKDTIEEKVLALQEKKKKLFQNVLEDGQLFSSRISEEDIKNIFMP